MKKSVVLYTALALGAIAAVGAVALKNPAQVVPAAMENRAAVEGLREGDMKKLQFLAAPKPAPDIVFEVAGGGDGRLSDYKGKWVAVFFYPKDFTYVCPVRVWVCVCVCMLVFVL